MHWQNILHGKVQSHLDLPLRPTVCRTTEKSAKRKTIRSVGLSSLICSPFVRIKPVTAQVLQTKSTNEKRYLPIYHICISNLTILLSYIHICIILSISKTFSHFPSCIQLLHHHHALFQFQLSPSKVRQEPGRRRCRDMLDWLPRLAVFI